MPCNKVIEFTFFPIGIFSLYKIFTCRKTITVSKVFYIFAFIFLFYAPLQQYLNGTVLWKTTGLKITYSANDYLFANLLLLLFFALFEISYTLIPFFYKKFFSKNASLPEKPEKQKKTLFGLKQTHPHRYSKLALIGMSAIALLFLIVTGNLTSTSKLAESSLGSQIIKIVRFFPVACFLITYFQSKAQGKAFDKTLLIYATEILIIYFPFYGSISRFFLFGVYLSIISAFLSDTKIKSWYFAMFVVGFFFVFSAFNFFKSHGLADLAEFKLDFVNFCSNDYDAYQLFMMTMKYCKDVGTCGGMNLLTALLSFVPRSIWAAKLLPSGEIVSGYYGTWFTNLSCPWFAEWYFAFGVLGIILGGFISGFLLKWLDGLYESKNWLAQTVFCSLTGFIIFIVRGALLPTLSYFLAIFLCMVFVYVAVMTMDRFFPYYEEKKSIKIPTDPSESYTLQDVQKRLLHMMRWFHEFCVRNHIRYYAVGGTVLGTIRHRGFIPWDDDIDVGVPRKDYNRLIQLMQRLPKDFPYTLEAPLQNKDYIYPFSKLYDTRTTLIEDMQSPLKRGVYIDVFPLDGVGDNPKQCKKTYRKIFKSMSFLHAKTHPLRPNDGFVKRVFYKCVKIFRFIFGSHRRSLKKINQICEKKPFDDYAFAGNLVGSWKEKEIMKKEWFGRPTLAQFETIQIFIPQNPDAYLSHLYGNYMQLPPKEKQQSHHHYLYLNFNRSYLED